MFTKSAVHCPVGNHIPLGYLVKGKASSFICRECRFIFTWDEKGKLQPPEKLEAKKKEITRYCDKDGCICHS